MLRLNHRDGTSDCLLKEAQVRLGYCPRLFPGLVQMIMVKLSPITGFANTRRRYTWVIFFVSPSIGFDQLMVVSVPFLGGRLHTKLNLLQIVGENVPLSRVGKFVQRNMTVVSLALGCFPLAPSYLTVDMSACKKRNEHRCSVKTLRGEL